MEGRGNERMMDEEIRMMLDCDPCLAKISTFGGLNSPLYFATAEGQNESIILLCVITMSTTKDEVKIPLKYFAEKGTGKFLFAEAESHFVDTLFSFLTMPMGTILRLLTRDDESPAGLIGSLGFLQASLKSLDSKYFWTKEYCKELLLKPRNASECECHKIKINLDTRCYYNSRDKKEFYQRSKSVCDCSMFSPIRSDKCSCGKEIFLENVHRNMGTVFVPETTTFIITGDLQIKPNSLGFSIALLNGYGIRDMSVLEEHTHSFDSKEFLALLKCLLSSNTPLEDVLVSKEVAPCSKHVNICPSIRAVANSSSKKMILRLTVLKSSKRVLFAQAQEDFVDFIFSFLTIPLGKVVNLIAGKSGLGCTDNLLKSVTDLSVGRDIISLDHKNQLISPQLAYPYLSKHHLLALKEDQTTSRLFQYNHPLYTLYYYSSREYDDKKNSILTMKDARFEGGFVKGPDSFIVTDDLAVMHLSTMSALSFLHLMKIPFCDVEEQIVSIGVNEGLSLLEASLHTGQVLTNGLSQFLKKPKEEP